jgi:hypothetical protein
MGNGHFCPARPGPHRPPTLSDFGGRPHKAKPPKLQHKHRLFFIFKKAAGPGGSPPCSPPVLPHGPILVESKYMASLVLNATAWLLVISEGFPQRNELSCCPNHHVDSEHPSCRRGISLVWQKGETAIEARIRRSRRVASDAFTRGPCKYSKKGCKRRGQLKVTFETRG